MKKQKFFYSNMTILVSIILVGIFLSACASPVANPPALPVEDTPAPQPITLVDGLGTEITLPEPAKRIISLAPSNTELLFAVGAGSQVVGRDVFSDYPAETQNITDIGGGFGALNNEVILSLDSDLVLVADITPAEQIQGLKDMGLTVFSIPNANDFNALYENLRTVARLTGHEQETETLIVSLKDRVAAVEKAISQVKERPLVFYELDSTDANAPYTAGPGTFIDYLITAAGGEHLGGSLDAPWVQISVEELISRNPEIIVLGDYTWGGVTPEDVAARSGWVDIDAVKNGKVYIFDDNLVSRPGPRLVEGLETMAKLLHPDLFK